MRTNLAYRQGQIILLALVFFAIMSILVAALVGVVTTYAKGERHRVAVTKALLVAESGIDKAAYELNQNANYTGETGVAVGDGELSISVASIDSGTKEVTATGYYPDNANPVATKTVKARMSINSSVVSFRFGVQVGDGGVTLNNNSQIVGNLFSNGSVTGDQALVTGDLTVAGGTTATPDQEWTVQNSDFNLGDVSARANLAQSFRPSVSTTLNKVSLYLKKVGTPGDITLKVVTDNAGKPSKTVLASGSIPASAVTGTYNFAEGALSPSPSLTAGQTYWIIAIATVSASNYFKWGEDNTDGYANGTGKYSSNWNAGNPVWTSVGGDLAFKIYVGGVTTLISGITVNGDAWAHSLSSCTVGGDAHYQTISSCAVSGTSYPGSTDASPGVMPISEGQIDEWEAAAEAGGVIAGPYTVTNTQTLGPKKIDGNLTVNNGGIIYLTGPLWVKGNILAENNSGFIVDASTGNNGAIVIADSPGDEATKGTIDLSNNVVLQGNGNPGSYPMLLSTNSGANAITLENNVESVILYASRGFITVENNGGANQITAYGLHLNNNVTVTYINGLQNQGFSNGPGGSWAFIPGSYSVAP